MDRPQTLDRAECLQLLAQRSVGRVAFTERALPAIQAVSYSLVGQSLLLRTVADGLGRRLDGQVVAFEVGELDDELREGWSVVVTGKARLLAEPADLMRYGGLPSAAGGQKPDSRVCLTPGKTTGRRASTPDPS